MGNKERQIGSERRAPKTSSVGLRLFLAVCLIGFASIGYKIEESGAVSDSRNKSAPTQSLDGPTPEEMIITDDSKALERWQERDKKEETGTLSTQNIVSNIENLEVRTSGNLTLAKLLGNWSEKQINLLLLGDKFTDNKEFLELTAVAVNQIFSVEPFTSNVNKFGAYALSVGDTPSLDCFKNLPLCNNTVRQKIDEVTNTLRFHMVETIVIANNTGFIARGYLDGPIIPPTVYGYAVISKGLLNAGELSIAPHELGHTFGNLADEYEFNPPLYPAPDVFINCLNAAQLAVQWANIPNQPGTKYPGCADTSDGHRDALEDLMRIYRGAFGPVDTWQLQRLIEAGPSRYSLTPPIEKLANKVFVPLVIQGGN